MSLQTLKCTLELWMEEQHWAYTPNLNTSRDLPDVSQYSFQVSEKKLNRQR
jgi:hypothetical protein